MTDKKPTTIDDYITGFPKDIQVILQTIRERIQRAIPEATETISYGMPTFDLNGRHLVYFSAWKDHIGLYPLYSGDGPLEDLFASYRKEQNSIHLPYADPFPYELVKQFALLRKDQES
jgi:uncharacterized protein YdhG (YjbR/CyaY superfamily)